jgi:hypothetical protein
MEMITMSINPSLRDEPIMVSKKPPLPPKKTSAGKAVKIQNHVQWKSDEENGQQIAKLLAQNEKLILEISDLRVLLQRERNGVRELR